MPNKKQRAAKRLAEFVRPSDPIASFCAGRIPREIVTPDVVAEVLKRHIERSAGLEADLASLAASPDPAKIVWFLWQFRSEERSEILLNLIDAIEVDAAVFWSAVAMGWCSFDRIPHAAYAQAFREFRGTWTPACMIPGDRAVFDAMPHLVTVYRGQSFNDHVGLAWSLRKEVADKFAQGHRGICIPEPCILSKRVKKSSIAFYCGERDEAEVVLFGRHWRSQCDLIL